jgi:hypothetical protein
MEATRYEKVLPGVFRWEAYSPHHKVHLTSHAVVVDRNLFVFDPIPLTAHARQQLLREGEPAAIVLTNDNHERDAARWRDEWRVPIWAAFDARLTLPLVYRFASNTMQWFDWRVYRVAGGSCGETGFFLPKQSLMVLGDALTNLPDYDLMVLTEKYCADRPTLLHSLRQLVLVSFRNLLTAHGRPVLGRASQQVEALL